MSTKWSNKYSFRQCTEVDWRDTKTYPYSIRITHSSFSFYSNKTTSILILFLCTASYSNFILIRIIRIISKHSNKMLILNWRHRSRLDYLHKNPPPNRCIPPSQPDVQSCGQMIRIQRCNSCHMHLNRDGSAHYLLEYWSTGNDMRYHYTPSLISSEKCCSSKCQIKSFAFCQESWINPSYL